MRIGTYNILGCTGYPPQAAAMALPDAAARVSHFAVVFGELDCDVLVLQEGPSLEIARRIAEGLGCHLAMFPSPTAYPGYILSRYPIRESRAFSHPGPGGREGPFSRCAGAARLEVAGQDLWVAGVHLHPSNRELREREAGVLAVALDGFAAGSARTIVAGDFNCQLGEAVHAMLAARGFTNAMVRAGGGAQATMDTAGIRPLAIDHIYVSQPLAGALATAGVVRDAGFRQDGPAPEGSWVHSDHLPVVAQGDWP